MRPEELTNTIADIRELHRRRQDFLAGEGNLKRQCRSVLTRFTCDQYSLNSTVQKERTKSIKLSHTIYDLLTEKTPAKGAPKIDAEVLSAALGYVQPWLLSMPMFVKPKKEAEKALIKTALKLPIAEWMMTIKGIGVKSGVGLGQIIGEAGDLSRFTKKSQLWKRMGVAVIDGERQRKVRDAELAVVHGYSPNRRAILFNLGESMIRAQGTYVPVYYREKARQELINPELLDKKGGKAHIHNRARRYMEKLMLRDIWQVWTGRKPMDYIPHGDSFEAWDGRTPNAGEAGLGLPS